MKQVTIISKRPSPFVYTKYVDNVSDSRRVAEYSIIINGGSGVVGGLDLLSGKKAQNFSMIVPEGVATIVDEETLKRLRAIDKFCHDEERKLILVIEKVIKDQEKIDSIADSGKMMAKKDLVSHPITKEDLKSAGAVESQDGSFDFSKASGDFINIRKRGRKKLG